MSEGELRDAFADLMHSPIPDKSKAAILEILIAAARVSKEARPSFKAVRHILNIAEGVA